MKKIFSSAVIFSLLVTGCIFKNPLPDAASTDEGVIHEERNVSGKLALALGGMNESLDQISIDEPFQTLDFENNDPDLFRLESFANGVRVIPLQEGVGYVTPVVNGRRRDPVQVTIPPQKLIQIFLGEARGQIQREALLDDVGRVRPSSVSLTADALGAVIRNRIQMINQQHQPSLFVVDELAYGANPPISYYDAVIEAEHHSIFQFSPVDPEDPSHDEYLAAEERAQVSSSELKAYDQAVLSAADIFNEDTEDPTRGAFAFYSPTPVQYAVLADALQRGDLTLPVGSGASDANYPALAPIQILILKNVATFSATSTIPSFVFIRERNSQQPAVTDQP